MTYEKITRFERFCDKYGNLYAGLFCVFASWLWIGGFIGIILSIINYADEEMFNCIMGFSIALTFIIQAIFGWIMLGGYERFRYKYTHNKQLEDDAQMNLFRDFGIEIKIKN